jgi:hypothetical protein
MTPRLTRTDSIAVYSRLKVLLDKGASMSVALQELVGVEDVMDLLSPVESRHSNTPFTTVLDIARR